MIIDDNYDIILNTHISIHRHLSKEVTCRGQTERQNFENEISLLLWVPEERLDAFAFESTVL